MPLCHDADKFSFLQTVVTLNVVFLRVCRFKVLLIAHNCKRDGAIAIGAIE